MMNELPWIAFARTLIGIRETPGSGNNPQVVRMFETAFKATGQADKLKHAVWRSDSTPWCGIFMAYVMANTGLTHHIPKAFPMARSFERAGSRLSAPAYGCVVTFTRTGGGHVGFVVGEDGRGNIMVLGGNQSDGVNIKPFARNRVTAYRWCGRASLPSQDRYRLNLVASNGRVSTNEA